MIRLHFVFAVALAVDVVAVVVVVVALEHRLQHELTTVDCDAAIVHSVDSDADEVCLVWSV